MRINHNNNNTTNRFIDDLVRRDDVAPDLPENIEIRLNIVPAQQTREGKETCNCKVLLLS